MSERESLGQVLKRYRLDEGYTIRDVENELKISAHIIKNLEKDDYSNLPADLYVINFIKSYAGFLGLDKEMLLNIYYEQRQTSQTADNIISPKKARTREIITPKILKLSFLLLIILAILVYFGVSISKIFKEPMLNLTEPDDNKIISQTFVDIKGQTEKEARVYINNKEIFLDDIGNFSTTLDLQKGLNIIKISSQKKHSKEAVVYRQILVE